MQGQTRSNSTKTFRENQSGRNTLSQYDKNLGKLVPKDHRAVESVTSGPWEVFKEARETERASWKGQTIQKAMTSEGTQGPSHLELLGAERELEILTLLKWLASSTLLTSELLSAWSHIIGTKKQNDPNLATHQ